MTALTSPHPVPWRVFLVTILIVSVWVNASEVARYFLLVMPAMREMLAVIPDVAPMNLPVFLIWGLWDTLLVLMAVVIYWLVAERFGPTLRTAVGAGTLAFLFFFVLFWVGTWNMNLAEGWLLPLVLPWAWIEMVVACLIARWSFWRFG
ncbi:MAG: hypothetical protein AAF557_13660 [Pseudomonadota bacterium]